MSDIQIVEITQVTEALVKAFERLVPQLSANNPPPTREELEKIVAAPGTVLFAAYHTDFGEEMIGALALVLYRVPTGAHARIEDVVVDERARGRGIGEALTHAALERAFAEGAANVELTSNPARLAANRLYQRLGFIRRQTNVYRYKRS